MLILYLKTIQYFMSCYSLLVLFIIHGVTNGPKLSYDRDLNNIITLRNFMDIG